MLDDAAHQISETAFLPPTMWENTLSPKPNKCKMMMCCGKLSCTGERKRCSLKKICDSGHSNKWFSLGLCVCVCVSICVQRKKVGDKGESLLLCILLCDLEKTLRLFITEELMLPRINMAKSSYQLHNGQASEVKKTAPTIGGCVYALCTVCEWVCVCSHLPSFLICAGVCTLLDICFFIYLYIFFDSFNQRRVVKRCGGSVSFFYSSDKTVR